MRSIPTEENLAPRVSRYAARTSSTEWTRPRAARVSGRNDWTPRLTRLKPPSRSREKSSPVTVPGFASVVTSASSATGKRDRIAASIRLSRSGPRTVGVPPPKYTGVRRDLRLPGVCMQEKVHLALHEPGISVALLLAAGDGVEVAIPALTDAERHVNVDPAHPPFSPNGRRPATPGGHTDPSKRGISLTLPGGLRYWYPVK